MLLFLKFYYQNQTRHLYNYFLDVPLILLEIIISISLIFSNYILSTLLYNYLLQFIYY